MNKSSGLIRSTIFFLALTFTTVNYAVTTGVNVATPGPNPQGTLNNSNANTGVDTNPGVNNHAGNPVTETNTNTVATPTTDPISNAPADASGVTNVTH